MDWNISTGYIAQDLRDVTGSGDYIHKLVHRNVEDEDLVRTDPFASGSLYQLDYKGLSTISTQALIDLTKRVETLRGRITTLEG